MAKTKLSTFLPSMMLVLFLVSWVSLKTIVKDGNFPVSTNGVKGKNKLKFLIQFTHSLNSADDDSSRKNCLRETLLVITDKSWNSLHSSQQIRVPYSAFLNDDDDDDDDDSNNNNNNNNSNNNNNNNINQKFITRLFHENMIKSVEQLT